jgi:hypothetical protein
MGEGEGARGFGKSAYLRWFVNTVTADNGETLFDLYGDGIAPRPTYAAYCTFSTVDNLSLSNVLYDACLDIVVRRSATFSQLRTSFLSEKPDRDALYSEAWSFAARADCGFRSDFLWRLVYSDPESWRNYLFGYLGAWHRVRWGRDLFAALFAVLRALEIDEFVLCIDQVEDFASWTTPSYKLDRDLRRFAHLCISDPLFAGRLRIVLTMHPRAERVLRWYWDEQKLGPLSQSEQRCVLLEPLSDAQLEKLASMFLHNERIGNSVTSIAPFTKGALRRIKSEASGRAGYCLQMLHGLIEFGIDAGVKVIDEALTAEFLDGHER